MKMFKGIIPFDRLRKRSLRRLRLAGDMAQRQREWSKAGNFYRKYLAYRPNDAPILVQLGHGLKEMRRFDEAELAYRSALRAAPDDGDARVHLAALLRDLGKQSEALALDGVPAILPPSSAYTEHKVIHAVNQSDSKQGDIARDQKDWRSAALFYCEHLIKHPGDSAIWVQLGHMLKESLYFEDALYAYQVGKRLETEVSDVSLHLASLLMQLGRTVEAKPLWADMFQKDGTFFFPIK